MLIIYRVIIHRDGNPYAPGIWVGRPTGSKSA